MMNKLILMVTVYFAMVFSLLAQSFGNYDFSLSDYNPYADGRTDDTDAFVALFTDVLEAGGGTVQIPSGDYFLKGEAEVMLASDTYVFAYGARFYLPEKLKDKARIILFQGTDVSNFSWYGGYFQGYVFDHLNPPNSWEPNVNTRIFVIRTSQKGSTDRLTFRDIQADRIGGAVIDVQGFKASESEVINFATNISIDNCTFKNSGKFMWDYGLLWQIMVFPEDYSKDYQSMAKKYYENDLIHLVAPLKKLDDRIWFENWDKEEDDIIVSDGEIICLFNDVLPENIKRGKQYFVVESTNKYIKISENKDGKPLIFNANSGNKVQLINHLRRGFIRFAPLGEGPGKGSIDLVGCKYTSVTKCKISALGDAMHIHSSHYNVFSNNHIVGARMGAFFLAEFCKNSTITGNIIDGTNGSRVMSIEKSNEDVVVIGNTFRNGGRGSWINQPKNLIIKDNIFINNTTKGERDPWRGRRDYKTGEWQQFAEIYFTTWEKDASYGPVILKDNIFVTGPDAAAAIQFEENGKDILVEGNIFKGETGSIFMNDDESIIIRNNLGAEIYIGEEYSKSRFGN